MIATLIRPKLLSCRNRWRKQSLSKRRSQDVVLLGFSFAVMLGMYFGARWALQQMGNLPFLLYMPPSLPLGLMLLMLLGMLCISSLASSLGSLFLADDIELLLACPVSTFKLFMSRFLQVLITVAWMPFVFLFPVLLAFGIRHDVGMWFYPYTLIVLVPYFIIPVSCASLLGALIMSVIDPRWTRVLVVACVAMGIFGVIYLADLLTSLLSSRNDPNQVMHFVATLSRANSTWIPSAWAAMALSEALIPSGKNQLVRVVLLYSTAISLTALAYLAIEILHGRGYTRARNSTRSIRRIKNRRSPRMFTSQTWAMLLKEFRSLFRDLSQSTQILFLACMCLLYLANLKMFVSIESFPPESKVWWQNIFFIMHTSITAFFTSSICTRVVFSSVSLEGKYFWILQTAPIKIASILRSKFWAWFVPVSAISAVLFAAGTYVIIGRIEVLILYVALSFFVSYGIVGLGIGLGAYFADFSWEHPSQLALSLGSFVYMLASALLVIANIVPMSIILRLDCPVDDFMALRNTVLTMLLGVTVAAVNIAVAQAAMRLGEKSLQDGNFA
jgi:ABC-2 type transport system permease protein